MMNPYGMGFGGVGGENKRKRPASLLLDESPLKITLRINSLKVVAKEKDKSDAISALANKIEAAKVEEEEGGDAESSTEDTDGDEFYDWGGDMETVDWGDYESEDDEAGQE